MLEQRGQFPSINFVDIPLNDDARRYITNGPSLLHRWFPYSTAVLLDRLKILLLPFLVLIPLFRNKFYFDEIYAALIAGTQDLLATISSFLDKWLIDGVGVRGSSGATWGRAS